MIVVYELEREDEVDSTVEEEGLLFANDESEFFSQLYQYYGKNINNVKFTFIPGGNLSVLPRERIRNLFLDYC